MPSFDDDLLQILPSKSSKRMTERLSIPSVELKNNRNASPKDSDNDICSGKASPDNSETYKDSGTEKGQLLKKNNGFTDPLRCAASTSDDEAVDDDPIYFSETVDFPDSPLHLKLLKKRNREAQGVTTDDEEEDESATISLMGQHYSRKDTPTRMKTRTNDVNDNRRRKIIVNPDVLSSDPLRDEEDRKSIDSLSNKSEALLPSDDLETPDYADEDPFESNVCSDENWRSCIVSGEKRRIDMKVIEPYKKVLSHGGYIGSSQLAIIVFGACFLPDRSRLDYGYVMDNLFLYVLTTLDQLVCEDYVLVYLHGATSRSCMPSFRWLKRCYQMIDRRLRKNLKGLYLVHPTFWLKTIVIMTRPFISSKFSRKLRFVNTLQELEKVIPMDHVSIPDKVRAFDEKRILES